MAYIDELEVNSETRKIQDTQGRAMICLSIESSATATATHAEKSYFIYNNQLYKATAAIAIGDTITEGTNCETTSIADVMEHISDELVIDTTISGTSTNAVQNKVIKAALDRKQDSLTFDNTPTANSANPVKSGGVKSAIDTLDNYVKEGSETRRAYHLGFYIGEDGGLCESDS